MAEKESNAVVRALPARLHFRLAAVCCLSVATRAVCTASSSVSLLLTGLAGDADLHVQHELENWRIRIRREEGCADKWEDWWGWMVKVRAFSSSRPQRTETASCEHS